MEGGVTSRTQWLTGRWAGSEWGGCGGGGGWESILGQDVFLRSEGEVRVCQGWWLPLWSSYLPDGKQLPPVLHTGQCPAPTPRALEEAVSPLSRAFLNLRGFSSTPLSEWGISEGAGVL